MARQSFFDSKAVIKAVDKASRKVLSRFGAIVRTTAKQSLRPARMLKLSEMTQEQRDDYKRKARIAKQEGKPRPKRPKASSKPGQPPRLQRPRSPLKRLILFGYDLARKSVVVGVLPFGTRSAPDLEYGGHGIKARPFMRPSLSKNIHKLPGFWKDSVK